MPASITPTKGCAGSVEHYPPNLDFAGMTQGELRHSRDKICQGAQNLELRVVPKNLDARAHWPRSKRAASLAKYVKIISAPARLMAKSTSIMILPSSIQPF